jgi:hypothetical protein
MDKLLKAQMEVSERRVALSALLDADTPDTDAIEAAKTAVTEAEKRMQAVMVLDGGNKAETLTAGDAEGREIRQLIAKANLGRMVAGILEEGEGEGADRELRQALGIPADYIPLAMLEKRAAATFTGDEPATPLPFIGRVFPASAAAFCGVDVQSVGVGQITVPVLSTGVTIGGPHTDSTAVAESTGAVAITTLQPKRLNGSFAVKHTDLATFPMLEDALRMDLGDALQDAIDVDLLRRTAEGLLDDGADPPTVPANAATLAATFLSDLYGAVDGAYASNVNQIRVLYGPETYAYAGGLNIVAAHPETVIDKVSRIAGGILVTDNAGAYTANRQEALIIKGPARRNCVGALWNGVQIIRDEVSRAAEGEVRLHVIGMWDFAVVRAAGYVRKAYRRS